MARLIVIITAAGIVLSLLSASATLLETDGGVVDEQEVEGVLPSPSPTTGLRLLGGSDDAVFAASWPLNDLLVSVTESSSRSTLTVPAALTQSIAPDSVPPSVASRYA